MAVLIMSFAIVGCVNKQTEIQQPAFCDVSGPIFIGKEDVLTDLTARQILTHNNTGVKLCHWVGSNRK